MPVTKYAKSGDFNIAYQISGAGEHDLIYVPGWVSNVELMWDDPVYASILRRIGSFARLIIFDKRGTGMSDRVPEDQLPALEDRMDDVRAVMDAAGSERAMLMGDSEGGNMSTLFAATYPERTEGLILIGTYAKRVYSDDYPWAPTAAGRQADIEETERTWGDPDALPEYILGDRIGDRSFREFVARYFRMGASPRAAGHLLRMNTEMDTRAALPLVSAPALCIYRVDDTDVMIEEGRWIASQLPNARLVELPGKSHLMWASHDSAGVVDEIEEFVTGKREHSRSEKILATVLFTDIVNSTTKAAELRDERWRALLESHNQVTRAELARWRGVERGTTGDGFLATFDGPARAVRAALAIVEAMRPLGIEIRAGLHTGEVEVVGEDVAGMAVHIGSRIASMAGPSEVYVSRTVCDLVVGSRLEFEPRGSYELKGVPGKWDVFTASG